MAEFSRFDAALHVMSCFPGQGGMNAIGEVTINGQGRVYLSLKDCDSELDLKCRVLEFLSRAAYKTAPFESEAKNEKMHKSILDGINKFLGTSFTCEDMDLIYAYLGNRCNHDLTVRFVRSGYNLSLLKNQEEEEKEVVEAAEKLKRYCESFGTGCDGCYYQGECPFNVRGNPPCDWKLEVKK